MKNKTRCVDLTGQKFGRLTAIGIDDTSTRKTYWICQCECGNMTRCRSDSLQAGRIKSCGCLKKETDKTNFSKSAAHKKRIETGYKVGGTRLYSIWQGMKKRCYDKHDARYDRYGGRGIDVCKEWRDNFVAFHDWALANGYSDELTIDRIDNGKGYSPDNCRWATQAEQSNNRGSNIKITIGNSTRTLMEWCNLFCLDYKKIHARYIRNGFAGIDDLFNK